MAELNPVLVKELRGRMRGPRAFVLLTIYLGILSGAMLLLYLAVAENANSDLNAGRRIGQALFYVVALVALIEVCVITPLLTAGSISGEKERETYDLLISSLLSPWQILWGKLAAALAYALLLVLSIVPLMSLAFLFGGVGLSEVLIALAGMLVTAVFYACIGVFWSATMRSTLGASSLALGSVLLMLIGIPFLWFIFSLLIGSGNNLARNSPALIYLGGAALFSHPFIALAFTESLLREGRGMFYTFVTTNTGEIAVPSPWIAYIVLALFFSLVLVLFSVRALRPMTAPEVRKAGKKAPADAPDGPNV